MSSTLGLDKTIITGTIDSVFKEVTHSEDLGLRSPAQLRLFHLKLDGDTFSDEGLYRCLRNNIGQYVYSRSRIERFVKSGNAFSVGLEAMQLIAEKYKDQPEVFGNMLGEILLYAFFEEKLGAPKIFSKIELDSLSPDTSYDGVHLLDLGSNSFQMVFGTSYVEDQIDAAVENAFAKIKASLSAPKAGIGLVSEIIFEQRVDDALADALATIITPDPNAPELDSAYGIFLCYSVGLDKSRYYVAEYKQMLERKMVDDLRYVVPKIKSFIEECGLSSKSFYIYGVPLDDATSDKATIMRKVTGGVIA